MEAFNEERSNAVNMIQKFSIRKVAHLLKEKKKDEQVKTIQKFMKSRMSRHLIEKQRQNKEYGKYVGTIRKPVKEEVIHKLKYMASHEHREALREMQISNMASYTDKRRAESKNLKRQVNSNYHSQMNVITENQIDMVKIIKDEEKMFYEIKTLS